MSELCEYLMHLMMVENEVERLTARNLDHMRTRLTGDLGWFRLHAPSELLARLTEAEQQLDEMRAEQDETTH